MTFGIPNEWRPPVFSSKKRERWLPMHLERMRLVAKRLDLLCRTWNTCLERKAEKVTFRSVWLCMLIISKVQMMGAVEIDLRTNWNRWPHFIWWWWWWWLIMWTVIEGLRDRIFEPLVSYSFTVYRRSWDAAYFIRWGYIPAGYRWFFQVAL